MPYLGRQPGVGVRNRYIYTATASQTTFSGADDNGATLAYDDAAYVDVYLNGVLLIPVTDYAATTKTSVVLTSGAAASDLLEILAYEISSIADTVSKANGGTFDGAITVNGNFSADGGTIKLDGNYPVGSSNVAIGDTALDDASFSGANNVAVGHAAMSSTTSGNFNSGVGAYSLNSNTTGSSNSSYGSSSLENNTTGSSNAAYGAGALNSNTTASNSVAVGYQAGFTNNNNANTFLGYQAGYSANEVSNTFVGASAGSSVSSGSKNTILGRFNGNENGLDIRTSSNNIVLSDGDGNPRVWIDANSILRLPADAANENATSGEGVTMSGSAGYIISTRTSGSANVYLNKAGTTGEMIRFLTNGGDVGSIDITGSSTSYNTSSDYRLKENVVELTGATERLKQLNPSRFNFIADPDTTVDGFIAHEVQAIVPEAITGTKDEVDADGNPEYQGIDQSKLVPLLVATIKELEARITALENA